MASKLYPKLNDRSWLVEQYVTKGHTSREIAAELNCAQATVLKALIRHDLERRLAARRQAVFPGDRFGRLRVLHEAGRGKNGQRLFCCRCECGAETMAYGHHLRSANTASCGCLHRESAAKQGRIHNLSGHPMYERWVSMLARCNNPNHKNYKDYGGRGIRVCHAWRYDFGQFLEDVGKLPGYGEPRRTLDRYPDNDGDYEPGNVRWATPDEQRANRRSSKLV